MRSLVENLKNRGLIAKENIGFDQIVKHISRAQKDLVVAKANLEIDSEAAYNYSYLAMLRAGRALMFNFGYRPIDGQQHKTIVEFCRAVLDKEFSQLTLNFDKMRKFRNRFTYDEPGILVSKQEAKQSLQRAQDYVKGIAEIIQAKNPQKRLL